MATLQMYYEDTGWTNFKLYEFVCSVPHIKDNFEF